MSTDFPTGATVVRAVMDWSTRLLVTEAVSPGAHLLLGTASDTSTENNCLLDATGIGWTRSPSGVGLSACSIYELHLGPVEASTLTCPASLAQCDMHLAGQFGDKPGWAHLTCFAGAKVTVFDWDKKQPFGVDGAIGGCSVTWSVDLDPRSFVSYDAWVSGRAGTFGGNSGEADPP